MAARVGGAARGRPVLRRLRSPVQRRRCQRCRKPLSLPFSRSQEGEAIHMPDREAVWTHFAAAIDAYRRAADAEVGVTRDRHSPARRALRLRNCPLERARRRWARGLGTPGRATSCSPPRTGGACSRTRITSEARAASRRVTKLPCWRLGGPVLSTLGTGARWARGVGLGRLMRAGRDGADAAFLWLGRPPLRTDVDGLPLRGYLRHRSFLAHLASATYEPEYRRLFLRELRPGATVVDAGAHIGTYSAARVPRGWSSRSGRRDRGGSLQPARARVEHPPRRVRERDDRREGGR